jgi:hypothetical protein
MSVDVHPRPRDGTPTGRLALALFLGPAAALADLQMAYMLVAPSCEAGSRLPLHLVHAAMFAVALAGLACGLVVWRRSGAGALHTDGGRLARTRFLAVLGILLSALFAVVVVAQWVGDFVLSPCQ